MIRQFLFLLFGLIRLSQSYMYPPVLLVPGLAGSVIRDNKKIIWPPPLYKLMFSPGSDLATHYNRTSRSFCLSNNENQDATNIISLYNFLVSYLGNNVMEAPYDFRLLGNPDYVHRHLYKKWKNRIEMEVSRTKKKCVIVAHSLGGNIAHDFIIHTPVAWREKYIHSFISINTPYGGTVNALHILKDKKVVYPLIHREVDLHFIRYIGGVLWSLPNRHYFPKKKIFREDDHTVYRTHEMKKIMHLIDIDETFHLYSRYFDQKLLDIGQNTRVKTFVFYSNGIPTLNCLGNSTTLDEYGDGDDTADIESLTLLSNFKHHHRETEFYNFEGSHLLTLFNLRMLDQISSIISDGGCV